MWSYDLAIQIFSFIPYVSIIGSILILIATFLILKSNFKKINILINIFISIFCALIGYFVIGTILFLTSSALVDTKLYPGNDYVSRINDQIRIYHDKNNSWPSSEDVVEKLDPNNFEALNKVAKTKYIYYSNTKSFYWFVRPSSYFVLVFTNKNVDKDGNWNVFDDVYSLSKFFKLPEFINAPSYPPKFDGPWDQLPN